MRKKYKYVFFGKITTLLGTIRGDVFAFLILLVIAALLLRFLAHPGFPNTHDGQNHLARLANFHLALIDRHFPVRWAPNLNSSFGYPVFNFNYYFPYILALVPIKLKFDFEDSLKLVMFLSFLTGGIFTYLTLKEYIGKIAALVGALFYLSAPIQLVTIYVRGSVGETVAMGLIPAIFWLIQQVFNKFNRWYFALLTLTLLGFLLSHNITVLFGLPILLIFVLIKSLVYKSWRVSKWVIFAFALAVGLSQFFWFPALAEKQFTNLDFDTISDQYQDHFLDFRQLFYSPWGYGFSVKGPNDGLSLEVGPIQIITVGLAALVLVLRWGQKKLTQETKVIWLFFLSIFIVFCVLMLGVSLPIWKALPFLHYAQFPWRLLIFTVLASSFLAAFLARFYPWLGLVLAVVSTGHILLFAKPSGYFDWNNNFYYQFPFTASVKSENLPAWFDEDKNFDVKEKVFTINQKLLSFRLITWKTQRHEYEVTVPEATHIFERTAYFPGWQVKIDGQDTFIHVLREPHPGLISFTLPAGKHLVTTVFTEATPARQRGDIISLVSLGSLVVGTVFFPKQKKDKLR